jgi:hypothetical protein
MPGISFRCGARASASEDQPAGKDQAVIVAVELAGRDLLSGAEAHAETTFRVVRTQAEFAEDNSGGQEILNFPVIGAAVVEGGVGLQFRPEVFSEMILSRGIPGDGPTQLVGVAGGQIAAESALNIQSTEALADRQGRGNRRVRTAILVASRGDGAETTYPLRHPSRSMRCAPGREAG